MVFSAVSLVWLNLMEFVLPDTTAVVVQTDLIRLKCFARKVTTVQKGHLYQLDVLLVHSPTALD
jgi:hypothetical protein